MTAALARHLAHAKDPRYIITPGDVRGMRMLLNGIALDAVTRYRRDPVAGLVPLRTADELLDALAATPHRITPEFERKGLAWFDAMRINPRPGIALSSRPWRNTELTRCFDERKREIVDSFGHFEFVGFEDMSNGYRSFYVPVYRVVSTGGEHFDYAYGSWQSGKPVSFPHDPIRVEPGKAYHINPSRCPHFIMVAEHYRNNGSCLCNDPGAVVMREWGYTWSKAKGQWV